MSLILSATYRIQIQTPLLILNLAFQKAGGRLSRSNRNRRRMPERTYPLGMVLDACPDIIDYSRGGITNWRDFVATVAVVRPMLGISPSAWVEAQAALGEVEASIVVAAILQRGEAINSAGGYLRGLTRRAEAGEFSLGPMLMALIGSRKREKQRA